MILQKQVFIGNVLVSTASALAFLFGGLISGLISEAVIPAVFAFLFHFGREIIKDLEDTHGDREAGINSVPIRFGKTTALWCMSGIFFTLILFTFYPYIFHEYHWMYMMTVLIGVDLVLIYVMYSLWENPDRENAGRLSSLLKNDMLI